MTNTQIFDFYDFSLTLLIPYCMLTTGIDGRAFSDKIHLFRDENVNFLFCIGFMQKMSYY